MLLCKYVVAAVTGFLADASNQEHTTTLRLIQQTGKSALAYYTKLHSHGLFLDRTCGLATYLEGCRYISGYCLLAQSCLGRYNLYAIKPKLHMWRHTLVEMRQQLEASAQVIVNPLTFGCEPNEDQIGRLSKLSRALDSRGISMRILQCFLMKASILHRRHCRTSEIPGRSKSKRPSSR